MIYSFEGKIRVYKLYLYWLHISKVTADYNMFNIVKYSKIISYAYMFQILAKTTFNYMYQICGKANEVLLEPRIKKFYFHYTNQN